MKAILLAGALSLTAVSALAAPVTYKMDPGHTYPSFEADHMGGVSKWRGKINSTSGSVTLDKEAQTGSVEVTMDMTSIDFGHDGLNEHAKSEDMFNVAEHPTATYNGELVEWQDGAPTAVDGMLTLHGVSQPVRLTLNSFKCQPHPQRGREVCGADAEAEIDRSDFGVDFGQAFGFDMGVNLRIQVEALALPE
ncbi:MAG: polyisoprenoid-binding protein [Gammaproteobacteria bacterium]|nr:polyisoprenoid-binding protein [Gammaproteobacteria bacterium]